MAERSVPNSRKTLVIQLGYRGAGFSGYAEQDGQRTVAGELRRALEIVFRRPCELTCAGRTDAGVSAVGQYVSLPVEGSELSREPRRIWRSLAAITPEDISIRRLYLASEGFSARFDALSRSYCYRIAQGNAQPVILHDMCWWVRDVLDVEAMRRASRILVGEHDFTSFCKQSSAQMLREQGRSTSRCVQDMCVREAEECAEHYLQIRVRGNAFLHNMVRIMVGSLVEVGKHRRSEEWLSDVLDARDRRAAGPTAPAQGLVFEHVDYPCGALIPWE